MFAARTATVLVVDDEPLVLNMLGLVLQRQGMIARLARSGQEAVELYSRHRGDIGLVLLDVQMPQMSGPQVLQALRQLDPNVRCCFMSGEANSSVDDLLALGALAFFRKPFSLTEVIGTLDELLSQSRPPAERARRWG
jgi:DNA-binding NtrC family response regulator